MAKIMERFLTDMQSSQEVHRFNNGYGASIVRGPHTYGGKEGLYELAVLTFDDKGKYAITYATPITDDVVGWLTMPQVEELLKQIEALEVQNG